MKKVLEIGGAVGVVVRLGGAPDNTPSGFAVLAAADMCEVFVYPLWSVTAEEMSDDTAHLMEVLMLTCYTALALLVVETAPSSPFPVVSVLARSKTGRERLENVGGWLVIDLFRRTEEIPANSQSVGAFSSFEMHGLGARF